ncbi:hypothetical protein A9Q83_10840 [Alphaproteobacteria bacterium 46_93_T64]|nr:hypothetical protein A9Q83_10840 [Alphaproteobacteria bacterium 46_93_T64]
MKRFYKKAEACAVDGGFSIVLDGRSIKTPAKAAFILPSLAIAEEVASEWDAQKDKVDPSTMPTMKYAATAIDRVTTQREKVIDEIAGFGATDLVCYRASYPEFLKTKQTDAWDPLLVWVKDTHGVTLRVTTGVGYIAQEDEALAKLRAIIDTQSDLQLSAIHDIVSLSGSLVVTLAVMSGILDAQQAFEVSELDETHIIEEWGEDAESAKRRKNNKVSLEAAIKFLNLCDQ